MGGAYNTHMGRENIWTFQSENLNTRYQLTELCVDGRTILKTLHHILTSCTLYQHRQTFKPDPI